MVVAGPGGAVEVHPPRPAGRGVDPRFRGKLFRVAGYGLLAWVLTCSPVAAEELCQPDPPLTEAAAELLLAHEERPSPQRLADAVRAAGSDAVGLHALFVPAGAGGEREWLLGLRGRVDGALRCGRADSEAGRLLIALGRGGALQPITVWGGVVRGELLAGFRDAELVIATGDGQLVRVGVSAENLREGVVLSPDMALPLKVQLVARGPSGPRPVAEREVVVGSGASAIVAAPGSRAEQAADAALASAKASAAHGGVERAAAAARGGAEAEGAAEIQEAIALASRVLALRRERSRGHLRVNRLLRDAASQHARDVCAKGRVAHEVVAGEGPDARLARAGLDARLLGEAIARADGNNSALQALQNSPSHLYTLLDPRFTDFGVGVAQDSAHKYCYVVLLSAWPRYIGKRSP
jgi:uncharacterized protein YkwD